MNNATEGSLRRRNPTVVDSEDHFIGPPKEQFHQPGAPIGYFAAQGTPYAKKIISKKLILFLLIFVPILIIVNLVIICLPVLWAVARHTLSVSVIHIYSSNITNPHEDFFPLTLEGQIKKAGVFPAHIYFRDPVKVLWNTPPSKDRPMREVMLGTFPLERVGVAAGHARIKQVSRFNITDVPAFTEFTKYMLTQEEFTWRLQCDNVHIEAFSFLPTFENLPMTKDVVFKGMDNFKDVKIVDFQLPSADPQGGISFYGTTQITNPSPFGVQLGVLNVSLFYNNLLLGPGLTSNFNLTPGINIVPLHGRLLPYLDNQTALNILGKLFTRFINYEVSPVVAAGAGVELPGHVIPSWLSDGVKVLRMNVPFQSPKPLHPIKSITIKQFNLTYEPDSSPYGPLAASDSLSAYMALPFGFPLRVVSVKNEITLVDTVSKAPIANVAGVYSDSVTDLQVVSAGQTAATLGLTLKPSPMTLPSQSDQARKVFEQFQKEFTFVKDDIKLFNGTSHAITDTPIGRVLLDGIKFSVESGLLGLQGLQAHPTTIDGVDVVGGSRDGIYLTVNTTIYNPSNVNLMVGDTSLLLVIDEVVGKVSINDMKLVIGANHLTANSTFNPKECVSGMKAMNSYISGLDTTLNISGFEGSTAINSLVPAFSDIRLNSTLPGLDQNLVLNAKLKVLSTTGIKDNVAMSLVTLNNPFSASLHISKIASNVSSHGLFIASIDTPIDFTAGGKSNTTSPEIPLHVNLYPPDMFAFLRALAMDSGQDPLPIDKIVSIGGYTYTKTTKQNSPKKRSLMPRNMEAEVQFNPEPYVVPDVEFVKRKRNVFTNFNLPNYVDKAFSSASCDINILSTSSIGDYTIDITFLQSNVKLITDDSLHKLLPVLAKPIVQKIIDGASLSISQITILNPKAKSFQVHLEGSIANSGPFNAKISFPNGLQVEWNNKVLGQIKMPDIEVTADEGAKLRLISDFAVTDEDALTEFTKFLVTEPSFVWDIKGNNLSVSAIGITVPDVTIAKTVILTGMNGLRNDVKILDYDLPSNDPAGGIHLTAQASVQNPSQVGIELTSFGVTAWRNGTNLGPVAARHAFTLNPRSKTHLPLSGRIMHQSGKDLDVLSHIFTDVVHGKAIPVNIHGDHAGASDIKWLNEGIKALKVPSQLPAKHFSVIKSIDISQMSLMFAKKSTWSPDASSKNTQAKFGLPFGFPIDIRQAGGKFVVAYHNHDAGTLNMPWSPTTTDVQQRIMSLQFNHVPLDSSSGEHPTFSKFITDATRNRCVKFQLHGSANAKAQTAAGYVTISGIPFNVDTSLLGLQNLNAKKTTVSNLDVKHGYSKYLLITLTAHLFNPSHLTVGTGDVSFDLMFHQGTIGEVDINNLVLSPGENNVFTNVHYDPQGSSNKAKGQQLLENYVQGVESTSVIQGSDKTTDIASLKQALKGIELQVTIPPLHQLLIIEDKLVVPKNIAQTSIADATFQLKNPFTASIRLEKVLVKVYYQGIYLGKIDEKLKPEIVAPGHTTITSRSLPLKMDLDPKHLIKFIEKAAANTNTNLGPLRQVFASVLRMSNTKVSVRPYPDSNPPNCHSGQQFDVFGAILSSLKGLKVKLDIHSTLKLDDFETGLNIVQQPIPTDTDKTALYLIGPVGAPIVQNIVDEAKLSFSIANITNVRNDGFDLSLKGSLTNAGPFDAYIEFPHGLEVTWQGKKLGQIFLPPICSHANVNVPNLNTDAKLKITNNNGFTDFTTYILHQKRFEWTVHSDDITVRALNIVFKKVKISKTVGFNAFNGLPGVEIQKFSITGQTSNALKIRTDVSIPSPATLGISLETASFKIFYKGKYQGSVHSTNLFLLAKSTTRTKLNGLITKKTGDKQLDTTGLLVSQYLQGKNQTVNVRGDSVVTKANGNKPVSWLSKAFQTLSLDLILPGHVFKIIYGITVQDLFVTLVKQEDTWNIPISSNMTLASFKIPYPFDLKPLKVSVDAKIKYHSVDVAELNLPLRSVRAGVAHGPNESPTAITLTFDKQRLKALDHENFQSFLSGVINQKRVSFVFHGTASLIARTVIGNLPLTGIPFSDITTSLAGFNGFSHKIKLKRADVQSATKDYLQLTADVRLDNPSNITLHTVDFKLPSYYKNAYAGYGFLKNKVIIPGSNNLQIIYRISPVDKNNTKVQELISNYIQPQEHHGKTSIPIVSDLIIKGNPNPGPPLSPFESLVPALRKVILNTKLTGIASRVVVQADAFVDLLTTFSAPGFRPYMRGQVIFTNPLPLSLQLLNIYDEAYSVGDSTDQTPLVSFAWTNIKGCTIPAARKTKEDQGVFKCPMIPNVLINRGLLGGAPSVGHNLDIYNMITARLGGANGYVIPAMKYNEYDVKATYTTTIGDHPILNVSSVQQVIEGITKGVGKLNKQQKVRFAQGLKGLGHDEVAKFIENGFGEMICAVEDLVPVDFLNLAKCKSPKTISNSRSQNVSQNKNSSSGITSSKSKISSKASSNSRTEKGQNGEKSSVKKNTSKPQASPRQSQVSHKETSSNSESSSKKGGLLGDILH